nr:hypothetical protein Iba_chr10aCG14190 [Ipomoea batatas]GMD48631.1 hypothetical protein Iba_chr10fCG8220 [Ipomoea batatas]
MSTSCNHPCKLCDLCEQLTRPNPPKHSMDSLRRSTQLLNEDQEMGGALGNNVPPPPVALLEPTMAEVMTRMLDMYEMEKEEHATFTGKQPLPLPGPVEEAMLPS